jgi:hypothetical protein
MFILFHIPVPFLRKLYLEWPISLFAESLLIETSGATVEILSWDYLRDPVESFEAADQHIKPSGQP